MLCILGCRDLLLTAFSEDLNEQPDVEPDAALTGNAVQGFATRQESATSFNVSDSAEEVGDEISSQPVVSSVGMVFDDLEVAKEVYNDYAFKIGFGIRIGNTKFSTTRNAPPGTILNRVFECVHTGKPCDEAQSLADKKKSAAGGQVATIDLSSTQKTRSKQAHPEMDVKDTRQRNRVLRYDYK
jgi:hypothetical protein